jgi:hypothetical protein
MDTNEAAQHYLALVTHVPYLSALAGMREMWDGARAREHVESAVRCFLRAYPELAAG